MPDVALVGAGLAGLAGACSLLRRGLEVALVDRLPAEGGLRGFSHPLARPLAREARGLGVAFALGTTALEWSGGRLLGVDQDGAVSIPARHLVLATGTRPCTEAELRIAGARCGGVVPATVAVHLVEGGALLGMRPVIVGLGSWARRAARLLEAAGAREVTFVPNGDPGPGEGAVVPSRWRVMRGARVAAIRGGGRVEAVEVESGGERRWVPCDAVVLAAGRVPVRNVRGALAPGPDVTHLFLLDEPASVGDVRRAADEAVARAHRALADGRERAAG